LPGWLFNATRFACAMHQRGEQRRKEREMRVFEESQITDSGTATEAAWEHMQPHLAGALDSLSGTDREAVLLRFYRKAAIRKWPLRWERRKTAPACGWTAPWTNCAGSSPRRALRCPRLHWPAR
jgi:hypothetical protein